MSPFATDWPCCTRTDSTTPVASARTASHSIGSTFPLVGRTLTSVDRVTRANGASGSSVLFR